MRLSSTIKNRTPTSGVLYAFFGGNSRAVRSRKPNRGSDAHQAVVFRGAGSAPTSSATETLSARASRPSA